MKSSKRKGYLALVAAVIMMVSASGLAGAHWADDYADKLVEEGYIKGYGVDNQLHLDDIVTRAQLATVLERVVKDLVQPPVEPSDDPSDSPSPSEEPSDSPSPSVTPSEEPGGGDDDGGGPVMDMPDSMAVSGDEDEYTKSFSDVKVGDWYYDSIMYLAELEIVTGVPGGKFDPDGKVERQQAAVMLARAFTLTPVNSDTYKDFSDSSLIATYAQNAVSAAKEQGIITGVTGGKFDPTGTLKRGEMVAMVYRALYDIDK